ncbi:MAG: peptidase, partial [Thaumarchaeota archaeon]|nr:peptidase [Nitrososphaerota archaeon]
GGGDVIPFEFTFFDENGVLLKDIRYGYSLFEQSGMELISNMGTDQNNPGIMAMEGINTQQIIIPSQDPYRIQVAIFGQGINYDQTYAGLAEGILELGPGGIQPPKQVPMPETSVPDWIKTSTGFWVDGMTSNDEFVQAIEFLINNDIIIIPPTSGGSGGSTEIPSWIKTTAGFWVDGFSTDKEFVAAIQFLIKEGIMKID